MVKFCSSAARALGIRTGMPAAEATALLRRQRPRQQAAADRSETLQVQPHDPEADQRMRLELAEWCQRFSPLVGYQTTPTRGRPKITEWQDAADDLLLDVTGLASLFGGENRLAEQVVTQFRQRGFAPRVAIADTVGAAWACAHFMPATAGAAGGRSLVVPAGASRSALAGLPVTGLRLGTATLDLLRQLGLERIEHVMCLPRESISARLGDSLLLRLDQALGTTEELIAVPHAPPDFEAGWQSEQPLENRRGVEEVLAHLTMQITELLAARDEGAVRLECHLDCVDSRPLCLEIGLFRPTAEARHVLDLLRLRFERLVLPAAVQGIRLSVTAVARREQQQQELFADRTRSSHLPVARLVDRLSGRLGSRGVLRPALLADAQPEQAWVGCPLAGASVSRVATSAKRSVSGPRPLRLHNPALPLSVVAVAPDGPPIRCYLRQWLAITHYWGPERIETGWWRGPSIRRDYYRIQTATGSRFWIYRQLPDGQWWLQGEFD